MKFVFPRTGLTGVNSRVSILSLLSQLKNVSSFEDETSFSMSRSRMKDHTPLIRSVASLRFCVLRFASHRCGTYLAAIKRRHHPAFLILRGAQVYLPISLRSLFLISFISCTALSTLLLLSSLAFSLHSLLQLHTLHANNPTPKVAYLRCVRLSAVSSFTVFRSGWCAPIIIRTSPSCSAWTSC